MIFSPVTLALRAKMKWNRHCRKVHKYHNRVCMGANFCIRWMVYDGACHKHQDVYDKRAARRLKRARQDIVKRRQLHARRNRQANGMNPSGRY